MAGVSSEGCPTLIDSHAQFSTGLVVSASSGAGGQRLYEDTMAEKSVFVTVSGLVTMGTWEVRACGEKEVGAQCVCVCVRVCVD